jgi:lycopene cyclase domain-containing protein
MAAIGVVLAVALDLALLRTRLLLRRSFWLAYAIVLFFQLITNGILAALPVVRYDAGAILGIRVARVPVEDLLFGFALITATLSLWVRLTRGGPSPRSAGRAAPPSPGATAPRTPGR